MRRSLALLAITASAIAADRPNVLLIAVDDMRDWTGFLGGYGGRVFTPHMDRLAARGMAFTNAHTASPVCCPSRAAVMSGQLPSSTGIYNNQHWWMPHRPDLVTMPRHFKGHGYKTVGAGKIFHHTVGNNPPLQWHQFQRLVFNDDAWHRTRGKAAKLYPFTTSVSVPADFPFSGIKLYSPEADWGILSKQESDFDDARTVSFGIDFLKTDAETPFFLAIGLFRPHMPWYTPQKYADMYPLDDIVVPQPLENDLEDVPEPGRRLALRKNDDLKRIQKANKWKIAIRQYLASITFADAQIGRLLEALNNNRAAANTVIVLWSDHGWHLGEKEHWHKRTLWEEATRVPLIVCDPSSAIRGQKCAEPVSLLDIFPTLIELCDLPSVKNLDGQSLVPQLKDASAIRENPAITVEEQRHVAVRDKRYRYIRYTDGSEELYDHNSDKKEYRNLASDANFNSVKQRLKRWVPAEWAESAPRKSAYDFDPESYSWTVRKTGTVIRGSAEFQQLTQ